MIFTHEAAFLLFCFVPITKHEFVAHREARKGVQLGKARCLVVAPNVEPGEGAEGPAESLEALLALAAEHTTPVPVVFALTRKKLAQACGARGGVSVVAVLDASGAEQEVKQALAMAATGRMQWLGKL